MATEAIKIAVRVRPFFEKELAEKQECCIEMVSQGSHASNVPLSLLSEQ